MKFSDAQIATLKAEYAKHETAPLSILPKFHEFFAKLPTDVIAQLAVARIKFVSGLACNELARREVSLESVALRMGEVA